MAAETKPVLTTTGASWGGDCSAPGLDLGQHVAVGMGHLTGGIPFGHSLSEEARR